MKKLKIQFSLLLLGVLALGTSGILSAGANCSKCAHTAADRAYLAPYLNSTIHIATQHQTSNLRQRTFVCPVNGPVWVNSGIFCYKIWIDEHDGNKLNVESYNTLRRVPEGKLNFYQLDLHSKGYSVFSQNDMSGFKISEGIEAVGSLFSFRFVRFASGHMIELTNTDPDEADIFVEGNFAFSADELERVQRRVSQKASTVINESEVNPIPESGVFDSYGGDVMALFKEGRSIVVYDEKTKTKRVFSLALSAGPNGQDMARVTTFREQEGQPYRSEGAYTLDVFHNFIVHESVQAEGYRPGIKISNGMEHITGKTEVLVQNLQFLSENLLNGPFGSPVGLKPDHVYGLMDRDGRIVLMTEDSDLFTKTRGDQTNQNLISFTVNLKKHSPKMKNFKNHMLYAFHDILSLDLFRVETPVNPRLDKVYKAAEQRLRHSLNLFNFYREQKKSKELLVENVKTGNDYIRSAIELIDMGEYNELFELAETSSVNGLPIRLYMIFGLAAKLKPELNNFFVYKTFENKHFNSGVRGEIYDIAIKNPAMTATYPFWNQVAVLIGTNTAKVLSRSA